MPKVTTVKTVMTEVVVTYSLEEVNEILKEYHWLNNDNVPSSLSSVSNLVMALRAALKEPR